MPHTLPSTERILLGPGPSVMSPRVMRAMASPVLSHLDPDFVPLMDDLRERLGRVFRAPDGSFACAISGTGTAGMETVVANLVQPGTRVLAVVSGYFGDRLAALCARYGADVARVDVEWGRAVDPSAVSAALEARPADIIAIVHAETSTGVLNPVQEIASTATESSAAIQEVSASTEEMGAQVEEVSAQAVELADTAEQLRVLVARFRLDASVTWASGADDAADWEYDDQSEHELRRAS